MTKILLLFFIYASWLIFFGLLYKKYNRILIGFIIGFFIILLYWNIQYIIKDYNFLLFLSLVGWSELVEEILKIIPVVILNQNYYNTNRDLHFFASFVATGFSLGETYLKYLDKIADYDYIIFRGLLSNTSHIVFTIISVYGLIKYREKKNMTYFIFFLCLSFLTHYYYNEHISSIIDNLFIFV